MIKSIIKQLNNLRTIVSKINKELSSPQYYVVYKTDEGKTKTYLIGEIDLYKSFKNKEENRDNAGFKAYCFARDQVRSFRHDRIVSITKR